MPSKNSINRPKLTVNVARKTQSLAHKRDQRERAGLLKPARSSEKSKSGQIKSVPLDLYFQEKEGKVSGNGLTTKTLSKKRAKKIERNIKYAEQRKLLARSSDKQWSGNHPGWTCVFLKVINRYINLYISSRDLLLPSYG